MGLNKYEQTAYKKIVTQLARSCKAIQEQLWKEGKVPRSSLWTIRNLKEQIWRDYAANPDVTKVIKNFLSGNLQLKDIRSTNEYAQSLADMVTPDDDSKLKKSLMDFSKTKPQIEKELDDLIEQVEGLESELESEQAKDEWEQLGGDWKMKTSHKQTRRKSNKRSRKSVDNLALAEANWGGATGGNAYLRQCLGKRYQVIWEVLYGQLPQWKKRVVDTKPDDRISNELASDVCRATENFDEYLELVASLEDNPVSEKLRSSLIMLANEASEI